MAETGCGCKCWNANFFSADDDSKCKTARMSRRTLVSHDIMNLRFGSINLITFGDGEGEAKKNRQRCPVVQIAQFIRPNINVYQHASHREYLQLHMWSL